MRLTSNYCLIARLNLLPADFGQIIKNRCDFELYTNAQSNTIAVLRNNKHFEPLLNVSSDIFTNNLSEEIFVGAELDLPTANSSECLDTVFNLTVTSSISAPTLDALCKDFTDTIKIFETLGGKFFFLFPSREWKRMEECLSEFVIIHRILGLSVSSVSKIQSHSNIKHSYSLILARTAELTNQTVYISNASLELKKNIEKISNRTWLHTANDLYQHFEKQLYETQIEVNLLHSLAKKNDIDPYFFEKINLTSGHLSYLRKSLSILQNAIFLRINKESDAGNSKKEMRFQGELDLLTSLDVCLTDFVRASENVNREILVALDDSWSPSAYYYTEKGPICFSVPSWYLLRFGLVPALSHEIAHLLINRYWLLNSNLLKEKLEEQVTNFAETLRSIDKAWRMRYFKRGWDKDGWANLMPEEVHLDGERIYGMFNEAIADMLSILITGPSYLYATARLLYESNYGHPEDDNWSASHNSLKRLSVSDRFLSITRLMMLRNVLEYSGVKVRMEFPDVREDEFLTAMAVFAADMTKQIVPILAKNFLSQPYGLAEHQKAEEAKRSLVDGKEFVCDSRILLDALWDTVFDGEGYANEVAIIFSILKHKDDLTAVT